MRIRVDHPILLEDLVRYLERANCSVVRAGADSLDVEVRGALREDAARLELDLYLRVWEAKRPGARAVRLD